MAFQIKWTRRASRDLAEIEAYIAQDDTGAAQREAAGIIRKADILSSFPNLGPIYRHAFGREYRSLLSGKYRIVYLVRRGEPIVDIITIRHGAQGEPELS